MFNNPYKIIKRVDEKRKVYVNEDHPSKIWRDVISQDMEQMTSLCHAMSALVYNVGIPKWLVHTSAALLYHLVYRWKGHYMTESDYFSQQFPMMSASLMAFLQRQYTLAHMGCSVVMTWDEKNDQMLCMRSLDWKGADDIALATRQFSFVNNRNEEIAKVAGITAMVGVLTGVKKGFSIAINYAPWRRSARFQSDPTFLIRELLENEAVDTYHKAVEAVKAWKVGSPCFISICGVKKGEACIVELATDQLHIREIGQDNILVQTNHYDLETSPFVEHNEPTTVGELTEIEWYQSELLENSQKRAHILHTMLDKNENISMREKLLSIYNSVPIMNYETAQWVLMNPKKGEMDLYALLDT